MNSKNSQTIAGLVPNDYWKILSNWPKARPLLTLGGKGSNICVIALEFSRVDESMVLQQRISPGSFEEVFPEYFGLIPYEAFSPQPSSCQFRLFRIGLALIFDNKSKTTRLVRRATADHQHRTTLAEIMAWKKDPLPGAVEESLSWEAQGTDDEYLGQVEECLSEIRAGRYYQINLLRYFELCKLPKSWAPRFQKFAGPFAVWVREEGFEAISFSPERFFRIYSSHGELRIETDPIKGTIAVSSNPLEDAQNRQKLIHSSKDQAELHMIVDLMRNDLLKICQPGSVVVEDPGSLHSFASVHHLIAKVKGLLKSQLPLSEILQALCPGGSITGAPKIEVMKAIYEKEGRNRDYFMGNAFVFDPDNGYFDSSILIRTTILTDGKAKFAAGSGIVIKSDPLQELQEIGAKGAVVGLGNA